MQNLRVATWNSVGYDVSKAQDLGQVLQTTGKIVDFIRMVHAA